MEKKTRLSRGKNLVNEIDKSNQSREIRSDLRQIDANNIEEISTTLERFRKLFPNVDNVLTPTDILNGLGYLSHDIPIGDCPSECHSCAASCQSCNACQSCDCCKTCESQHGLRGDETTNHEDSVTYQMSRDRRLRYDMIRVFEYLSKRI